LGEGDAGAVRRRLPGGVDRHDPQVGGRRRGVRRRRDGEDDPCRERRQDDRAFPFQRGARERDAGHAYPLDRVETGKSFLCSSGHEPASRGVHRNFSSGARRITLASAAFMTVATVIFVWAPSVFVLVLARFVQGFASGSIWTASMAWVTENAPPGHRGRESGIVTGMLSVGSVMGPGIGALAGWAGQGIAFGLVALVALLGVVLSYRAPAGRDALAAGRVWDGLVRSA